MKRVWAPWRNTYIKNHLIPGECFFCDMIQSQEDEQNLILYRGTNVFIVLNKYPYTNGHLMVVPYQHVSALSQLTKEVRGELMDEATNAVGFLKKAINPAGFNIGINLGKVAGAGLEDHLHLHIVPRWNGDSNFMTAIGETRVISVSLAESYQILKESMICKGDKIHE